MNFRTEIDIPKAKNVIDYNSKIILLGSCFSDNIGEQFLYYKFNTLSNPFGVIFNPISIEKLIFRSIQNTLFTKKDFVFYNDKWQSLDLHSTFSSISLEEAVSRANKALLQTKEYLKTASHCIITFGTSWVYRLVKTEEIIANCHKLPQTEFQKELLSVTTIKKTLQSIISQIKIVNPNATIIFTISPVRHLKDGFIENNLSKSHIIAALHSVLNEKNTYYFPSYEIMLDDLRDYRFYKSDFIHPNNLAVTYIWNKFTACWFAENTKEIMKKVASVQKRLAHKPFNPNTENHQKFLEKLQKDIAILKDEYNLIV